MIKVSNLLYILGNFLTRVSGIFAQSLLFVMTALITVDVVLRATSGTSTLISNELSGYLLLGIVFLGLAHTERAGRHIEINLITRMLPIRTRQYLEVVALLIAVAFVFWLCRVTIDPVVKTYITQARRPTHLGTPLWIPYLIIPVGFGLFGIELLYRITAKVKALFQNQGEVKASK